MPSAWVIRMEDRLGSLELGKPADLAIVDGNLPATPPERIADLGAWMTVIDSNVVWTKDQPVA